jgi:hypothetical protein
MLGNCLRILSQSFADALLVCGVVKLDRKQKTLRERVSSPCVSLLMWSETLLILVKISRQSPDPGSYDTGGLHLLISLRLSVNTVWRLLLRIKDQIMGRGMQRLSVPR